MEQLRELISQAGTVNHDEETPSVVQSIQSLRQAKESIHDKYAEESKVSSESGGESVEVADDKEYIPDFAQIDELQATVQELTKTVQSMKQNDHGKELTQLLRAQAAEKATKLHEVLLLRMRM